MHLRALGIDDYPDLREIYMNPNVGYPAALGAIEDEQTMLRLAAAIIKTRNLGMEEDGKIVGVIGHSDAKEGPPDEIGAVIGYAVNEDYWGKGFCTQAVQEYSYLLFLAGYDAVYADCFLDNPGSARVLEKAGFVYQHDFTKKFDCFDEPRQLHLYKKTAQD